MSAAPEVIDSARPEGRQIEYKREPPGNTDGDKKEFLADVTSFANTVGGDLLIGIDERRDEEQRTGIAGAFAPLVAATDAQIRRLEGMLRDGVAPRVTGIRIRAVAVEGGVVLLLRIPKSWVGLHQVTYQNTAKFYARNNAGEYQMDVHEIAYAFRSSADIAERVAQLIDTWQFVENSNSVCRSRFPFLSRESTAGRFRSGRGRCRGSTRRL